MFVVLFITLEDNVRYANCNLFFQQLIARNIHNKITEMEYTLNSLTSSKDETEYPEISEKCQNCLARAKELKTRSDTRTSELKDIRFQWELFESRFVEMLQWLEKTRGSLILPLKEKDEDSIEFVLGKLLKVREIEKKLSEKVCVLYVCKRLFPQNTAKREGLVFCSGEKLETR
jgi:hypothetical protein